MTEKSITDLMGLEKSPARGYYPAQCNCGHIFLEKYQFNEPTDEGFIGFCWCGFCSTKVMVKYALKLEENNHD